MVKGSTGATLITYSYDANGKRITETPASSGTVNDLYYSSAWQVIEERQSGGVTRQYVWSADGYPDDMVLRDDNATSGSLGAAGSGLGTRYYAQQDANHNVTAITDSSGNVVERFLYDPYGARTVLSATWSARGDIANWIYGFQGGRTDPVTGLINFRHRDLSTTLGRWVQQDPAGYVNGSDVYQLEVSSSERFSDPWGLRTGSSSPTAPPEQPPAPPAPAPPAGNTPSSSGEPGIVEEEGAGDVVGFGSYALGFFAGLFTFTRSTSYGDILRPEDYPGYYPRTEPYSPPGAPLQLTDGDGYVIPRPWRPAPGLDKPIMNPGLEEPTTQPDGEQSNKSKDGNPAVRNDADANPAPPHNNDDDEPPVYEPNDKHPPKDATQKPGAVQHLTTGNSLLTIQCR